MAASISETRVLLVGFDSAWTAHKRGAVAALCLDAEMVGVSNLASVRPATSTLKRPFLSGRPKWKPEQTFILLDQPTIVTNAAGQRPVEHIVYSSVSARRGGMQPANTGRVEMLAGVHQSGDSSIASAEVADPLAPGSIVTIETYPVLILIALGWTLSDPRAKGRLPKYNPERRKTFSLPDWQFLCEKLAETFRALGCAQTAIELQVAAKLEKPRKSDQDKLDARLCLLAAISYAEGRSLMVGDRRTGYIVVPHGDDLHDELLTRCSATGKVPEDWTRSFCLREPMVVLEEINMAKSWQQMTPAERITDRIAKNREREGSAVKSPSYWTVDRVAQKLNEGRQRATYGAVAGIVGGLARGIMQGRGKSPIYSWTVAVNGAPTGYSGAQIHPDCLRQMRAGSII